MRLLLVALTVCALIPEQARCDGDDASPPKPEPYVLVLFDRSKSIADLDPPETTQSVLIHLLSLAELSKAPINFGFIEFGQDIRTFPEAGGFSAEVRPLAEAIRDQWRKPAGPTPMDEALQQALATCRQIPTESHLTVVMISDGHPDSGRLRADDFPAVQKEIERRRKALLQKYAGHPPKTIQEAVQLLENQLRKSDSEEFREVYQLQDELERSVEIAGTMRREFPNLRFVTINLGEADSPITRIHGEASGTDTDFVQSTGHGLLKALDALQLTALPRVVRLAPREFEADTDSFERKFNVEFDPVAEAVLVTVEFAEGVEDFEHHLEFAAEVDGSRTVFNPDAQTESAFFTRNGKGDIVAATLLVPAPSISPTINLSLDSPKASLAMPACVVHSYFRLRADLLADIRPETVPPEQPPTFIVSPEGEVVWRFALRDMDRQPTPLGGASAIFWHRKDQVATEVILAPDPEMPNAFLSNAIALETGHYDVELSLKLESGASVRLRLDGHVDCRLTDGAILLDFPMPESGDDASFARTHIDFGVLGDSVLKHRIKLSLSTNDIPFPITVDPSVILADSGDIPYAKWITFDRTKITLHPGRVEVVFVSAKLPKELESDIQNGLYEGRLTLTDTESSQPYPIKRARRIAGVTDEDRIDRVTLSLRRPSFGLNAPRCFRNWIKSHADGTPELRLNVSVDHYFNRQVTLDVSHSSQLARTVTVLPSSLFFTDDGLQVDTVRLTPVGESSSLTQEIPPNGKATWRFTFEVDEECTTSTAVGSLDITADGVVPTMVRLKFDRRNPLLRPWIENTAYVFAAIAALLGLIALIKAWRRRQLKTGRICFIRTGQSLAGQLQLCSGRHNKSHFESNHPIDASRKSVKRQKRYDAGRQIPLPDDVAKNPMLLRVRDASSDPVEIEIAEAIDAGDYTEVQAEVLSGGEVELEASRQRAKSRRRLGFACVAVLVAISLQFLPAVRAAQWVWDLVTG